MNLLFKFLFFQSSLRYVAVHDSMLFSRTKNEAVKRTLPSQFLAFVSYYITVISKMYLQTMVVLMALLFLFNQIPMAIHQHTAHLHSGSFAAFLELLAISIDGTLQPAFLSFDGFEAF